MTGICGWFQANNQAMSADKTIDSMLNQQAFPKSLSLNFSIGKNSAVGSADHKTKSTFKSDSLLIACAGHIQWKDRSLQNIAQKEGDAVIIAKLYKEHGNDFLLHIHNDFSLVLIDQLSDTLILAIDRLGIQSLCYYPQGKTLIFSSDVQSLFKYPDLRKELSEQGIFNYFYFHMVPSPGSIYKNIEKLLPGETLIFSKGQIKKSFYWQTPYKDNNTRSFEQLKHDFFEISKKAVTNYSDEDKIGAFLSGGLDSSTISGLLSKTSTSPAKTYSIGFSAKGYDETPFARLVARHFNTEHHEYYVTPEDVLDSIPLIAQFYDEPFGNASAIPAYFCAKFAKEDGIQRLMGGDGGDEIFAGNERYTKQQIFEYYLSLPEILKGKFIEPLMSVIPGRNSLPGLSKINSYIQQAKTPLPGRLERYNFLNRTPLETIFNPDFLSQVDTNWPIGMLDEVYNRTNSDNTLHKMLHLDMKVTIADNDIRKVNKMCSLAGIDVAYPFLDDEMVNFAASIPPQLKIKQGKLRHFFKQATTEFLPDETINKEKHGFGLPFGVWMTEYKPLHDLARDSLNSLEQRGYFNKHYIEELWKLHDSKHSSYYGVMIWVMMMFEQWRSSH